MSKKYALRAVLLASVCFLPQVAFADFCETKDGKTCSAAPVAVVPAAPARASASSAPVSEAPAATAMSSENEVWVGTKWQSEDSAKYGRYNASSEQGTYLSGGFDVTHSALWDSGSVFYFAADGDDLNYRSQADSPAPYGSMSFGEQGLWGVTASVDNINYTQSHNFNTLYSENGNFLNDVGNYYHPDPVTGQPMLNAALGIPTTGALGYIPAIAAPPTDPGFTPAVPNANNVALSDAVNAKLSQVDVGTVRNVTTGSAKYLPTSDWTLSTDIYHEHKEGTKENSIVIGGTTLNSISATALSSMFYFPEPVDYDTNRYTVKAVYARPRLQGLVSYTFSTFENGNKTFEPFEPFQTTTGLRNNGVTTVYLNSVYSLPPDNVAHQVKAKLAYKVTPKLRLSGDFAYDLQMQDEPFVAETNLAPGNDAPALPRNSLDGKVRNLFGNVTVLANPFRKLDLKAAYSINDHENLTPAMGAFSYVRIDSNTNDTGEPEFAHTDFRTDKAVVEAGYRVTPSTKVTINDTLVMTDRPLIASSASRAASGQNPESNENTFSGRVHTQLTSDVDATLGASHSFRTMSDEIQGNTVILGYPESERSRNEVKGRFNWMPDEDLALGFAGKYYGDTYPETNYGRTDDHSFSANPDMSYAFSDSLTGNLFYSYERVYYDYDTITSLSGAVVASNFLWNRNTTNQVHTLGVGADWKVNNRLNIGMDYNFQRGNTAWDTSGVSDGDPVNSSASYYNYTILKLPSDTSTTHSLKLMGVYQVMNNVALNMGYGVERFTASDYLYDQVANDPTYANFTLPGEGDPDYLVQTVGAAVHVKW